MVGVERTDDETTLELCLSEVVSVVVLVDGIDTGELLFEDDWSLDLLLVKEVMLEVLGVPKLPSLVMVT